MNPTRLIRPLAAAPLLVVSAAHAIEPQPDWLDSYSAGGTCYCDTTFDHAVESLEVATPAGPRTVRQVCEAIGPGPGAAGNPIYNDVQCGNGPPNDFGDEDPDVCPGRVDLGESGCLILGPRWDLETHFPAPEPAAPIEAEPSVRDARPADPIDATPSAEIEDFAEVGQAWTRIDDTVGSHLALTDEGRVWADPALAPGLATVMELGAPGVYEVLLLARAPLERESAVTVELGDAERVSVLVGRCDAGGVQDRFAWTDCLTQPPARFAVDTPGSTRLRLATAVDGVDLDRLLLVGPLDAPAPIDPPPESPPPLVDGGAGGDGALPDPSVPTDQLANAGDGSASVIDGAADEGNVPQAGAANPVVVGGGAPGPVALVVLALGIGAGRRRR